MISSRHGRRYGDAFENYIRGITAATKEEKLARLREAVRMNPNYSLAFLELGKALYDARDYQAAANTLARVNSSDPASLEANFYLGLAAFYSNDLDRAENGLLTSRHYCRLRKSRTTEGSRSPDVVSAVGWSSSREP